MKTLEQAVEDKARAEAEAVLAEARKAAEAHWARESARLRHEHERRCEATRAQLQAALDHEMNAVEVRNRLAVLTRKNELLERVFQAAALGIVNLPDDGYREWLREQMARLPSGESLELMVNPRDRAVVSELLREFRRPELRLSNRSCFIKGGFIAVGKSSDRDCSLEATLDTLREALAEAVAEALFGGETP